MPLTETIVGVAALLVVFIGAPLALRNAWRAEQAYKAQEAARRGHLPAQPP